MAKIRRTTGHSPPKRRAAKPTHQSLPAAEQLHRKTEQLRSALKRIERTADEVHRESERVHKKADAVHERVRNTLPATAPSPGKPFPVVGIGSSAGGLEAMTA